MRDGSVILGAVRSALAAEPRIDVRHHHLALDFDAGVVTLEGELGTVAAKKLALERAAAVSGVRRVVDRLRVTPARRMGDSEIRDHVGDALLFEPALARFALRLRSGRLVRALREPDGAAGSVTVGVEGGVATLDGAVPSLAHKRLVGVLAWWVPGTSDVVNCLEVVPPEADDDGEICDAVRLALERDPLVDAGSIQVGAHRSVVTLGGVVPSEPEREMAEQDAWCVFGVNEVVNRIEVGA
jgi:osmotically-inducible protein OsmY